MTPPEMSSTERNVQLAAAAVGLVIAAVGASIVGAAEGLETGIAVFCLSWTLVALFVLGVRTAYRLLARVEEPPPNVPDEAASRAPASPRSRRRGR